MSDVATRAAAGDLAFVDGDELAAFVVAQRWFGSKSREVVGASVLEAIVVRPAAPLLAIALVEVRFQPGTHDVYQVPLGLRPDADGWDRAVVTRSEGWTVYDALADPELARELARLIERGGEAEDEQAGSVVSFCPLGDALENVNGDVWPMGAEQSNTSVVFGERLVLKAYRRLEAGVNPELELLRFLTRHGFANIAALSGWYEHAGRVMDATLGTLQAFVPGERDGWALAREALREGVAGVGAPGRVIRHHGDYHLGQALWTGDDWVVLDFEGEPARSLPERRRRRSPLRDVAGMLRSFAYASSVVVMDGAGPVPAAEWERRARHEFLAGYLPAAEAARILPPGQDSFEKLLALFELEKAVYELRYELDHRPDWVGVPVAGIIRLLDETSEAAP